MVVWTSKLGAPLECTRLFLLWQQVRGGMVYDRALTLLQSWDVTHLNLWTGKTHRSGIGVGDSVPEKLNPNRQRLWDTDQPGLTIWIYALQKNLPLGPEIIPSVHQCLHHHWPCDHVWMMFTKCLQLYSRVCSLQHSICLMLGFYSPC